MDLVRYLLGELREVGISEQGHMPKEFVADVRLRSVEGVGPVPTKGNK